MSFLFKYFLSSAKVDAVEPTVVQDAILQQSMCSKAVTLCNISNEEGKKWAALEQKCIELHAQVDLLVKSANTLGEEEELLHEKLLKIEANLKDLNVEKAQLEADLKAKQGLRGDYATQCGAARESLAQVNKEIVEQKLRDQEAKTAAAQSLQAARDKIISDEAILAKKKELLDDASN